MKPAHQMVTHQMSPSSLITMAALNFVAMFILMYVMVDIPANALPNLNQVYMAAIMTSAMMIIEVWLMRSMYDSETRNKVTIISAVVLVLSFLFVRRQTGIGDKQFLKSMIPHHASALLMCDKAQITDPDIKKLCSDILSSQQEQIDYMKAKLNSPSLREKK